MQIVYFLVNYQVIYVELIDKEKLWVLFSVFLLRYNVLCCNGIK